MDKNKTRKSHSRSHFEKNYKQQLKCKRSQITIFVIIAILIVAVIALALFRKGGTATLSAVENPKGFVEQCVSDAAEKVLDGMPEKTGIGDKTGVRVFKYKEMNIAYLCYTDEYKALCVNEHPMLNKEIENEILKKLKPEAEKCMASLKKSLSNYDYSEENIGDLINVSILPKKVLVEINKKISYTRNNAAINIEGFNVEISSAFFDFISLSSKILDQESDCDCQTENCNADTLDLMRKNPDFEITKPVYDFEKGKIYVIKDISGNKFQFAVKNCMHEAAI